MRLIDLKDDCWSESTLGDMRHEYLSYELRLTTGVIFLWSLVRFFPAIVSWVGIGSAEPKNHI